MKRNSAHCMLFGKYKGIPLTDIPDEYIEWLINDVELRDPLASWVNEEYSARFHCTSGTENPGDISDMEKKIVAAGYRVLALRFHPDQGGAHHNMVALNSAYQRLKSKI